MAKHEFGGDWTTDKLERVRKYLCAYTTIFTKNPKARHYTTKATFYPKHDEATLFGVESVERKDVNWNMIGKFFVERLKSIFCNVASNPLPLRNSTNTPIYLLCFAAGNPKGAPIAVKIAQHILKP